MWRCCKRPRQRGEILMEAMLGVVITAIMGAGMMHVAGQIMSGQHDAAVQALVVHDVQTVMLTRGVAVCDGAAHLDDGFALPKALDGKLDYAVRECVPARATSVSIGGVRFAGSLPPAYDIAVSGNNRLVAGMSNVVVPAIDSSGVPAGGDDSGQGGNGHDDGSWHHHWGDD